MCTGQPEQPEIEYTAVLDEIPAFAIDEIKRELWNLAEAEIREIERRKHIERVSSMMEQWISN